ncbi:MAG: tetratricopeptide repeat protein [Alphaproteobacteria bacterium]|nr:tetratricopeptide repeat protein [Alphaproteobacteria bacterium]
MYLKVQLEFYLGLTTQHCQQLAHVGVAGLILAGAGGSLATAAVCGSIAALAASSISGIWKRISTKDPTQAAAIERVAKLIEKDQRWVSVFGPDDIDMETVTRACDVIAKYGALYWPQPDAVARVVGAEGKWPDAVAAHVVDAIVEREPSAVFLCAKTGETFAREIALKAVASALSAAVSEQSYFKTLQPDLMMETLGVVGEVRADVLAIGDNLSSFVHALGQINLELFRLGIIDEKLDALRVAQEAARRESRDGHEETHALLRQLLAQQQTKQPVALPDPASEQTYVQAIEGLLAASGGARKRAAEKLTATPPDPDGALVELRQLAAQGEDGVQDAAQTYREIGVVAFFTNTQESLGAWKRVTELAPDDADAYNQLGHLYRRLGDLFAAEKAYKEVLSLGHQSADKMLLAVAYGNLGLIEKTRGNLDAAEAYHKKSLAIEKELGRKEGMASDYGNLGLIEKTRGNLDAAEAYLKKSLSLNEALGRKEGMANQYGNLGLIEQTRGNLEAAETYLKKSLAIEIELGRKEGMASDYGNLGLIEQTRGNLEAAEAYLKKSLAIEKELGRKEGMANAYGNLGGVEKTRGNLDAACLYWRKAHDLFAQIGMPHMAERVAAQLRDAGCDDPSGEAGAP